MIPNQPNRREDRKERGAQGEGRRQDIFFMGVALSTVCPIIYETICLEENMSWPVP
jgi:hypothetical protein